MLSPLGLPAGPSPCFARLSHPAHPHPRLCPHSLPPGCPPWGSQARPFQLPPGSLHPAVWPPLLLRCAVHCTNDWTELPSTLNTEFPPAARHTVPGWHWAHPPPVADPGNRHLLWTPGCWLRIPHTSLAVPLGAVSHIVSLPCIAPVLSSATAVS